MARFPTSNADLSLQSEPVKKKLIKAGKDADQGDGHVPELLAQAFNELLDGLCLLPRHVVVIPEDDIGLDLAECK